MTAAAVQGLFGFFLVFSTALQLWLSMRQSQVVLAHRHEVPADFVHTISAENHHTAAAYTLAKQRLARWEILFQAALLLAFTYGGGLNALDALSRGLFARPLWQGVALIGLFGLASWLLGLPFAWYRTFRLEAAFGFNQTTVSTFVADQIKGIMLAVVLGTPLVASVLYVMGAMGRLWWLYAWLLWLGFSLTLMWAFPKWIAPLFNKFQPLDDEVLKTRIEKLLARTGFASRGVFVMDGSRRSGHGNAYFTGLGKNKRIVFFDTLLKDMHPEEIEAVLAHELGHFAHKHIVKQLAVTFVLALVVLFVLGQLLPWTPFYAGLGVARPSDAMALVLFLLVLPVFTFVFAPLGSLMSRRNEFEADRFAARQSSAEALIAALTKLYRNNAASLVSDRWYARFYDSHPGARERIAALKRLSSKAA